MNYRAEYLAEGQGRPDMWKFMYCGPRLWALQQHDCSSAVSITEEETPNLRLKKSCQRQRNSDSL
jgi:hypothetical protein